MSQYVANTRDKISSATMMLALSEQDMEKKLGISNPLHRRKLKLALDYQKSPEEWGERERERERERELM